MARSALPALLALSLAAASARAQTDPLPETGTANQEQIHLDQTLENSARENFGSEFVSNALNRAPAILQNIPMPPGLIGAGFQGPPAARVLSTMLNFMEQERLNNNTEPLFKHFNRTPDGQAMLFQVAYLREHLQSGSGGVVDSGNTESAPQPLPDGESPGTGAGDKPSSWFAPAQTWSKVGDATGFPEAFGHSGRLRWRGGDHEGAFREYSSALSHGPPRPEFLVGRGLAAERLGDSELAHRDAAQALTLDPKNVQAVSLYKLTEGKVSRVKLAPQTAGLASPDPAKASVGERPGSWDGKGLDAAAVAAAARAKSGIPPSLLRRYGELLAEGDRALLNGDAPAAAGLFGSAISIDGGNAQGYLHRAAAWLKLSNAKAALDDAGRAVALAPGSAAAYAMRAMARNALADYRNALTDSAEATRLNPRELIGFEARAHASAGLGDRAGTLAALREAARLSPAYEDLLKSAQSLPEDGNLLALFAGGPGQGGQAPPARDGGARRFVSQFLLLGALVGGFLVALGLLHLLRPEVTGRITTTLRGLPGGGSLGEASPGFWQRYSDVKELAAGGMGVVYSATDPRLGRRVAVKRMREEIRQDPRERERFLAEARTVAGLRHENIVGIYGIEEDGEDAYLVFEYVEGRTLHDLLAERGRLTVGEALAHFRGICAALSYAHERNVVHRDLKPSNVMVDSEGKVRVMDFGIARLAKDALTRLTATQTVVGTPPYMAPEAEQGLVCKQSDVFSLGVCLYEALTGRLPFSGTAGAALLKKMAGEFEPASAVEPSLPPEVDRLLVSALDPKPESRLRTPRDFLAALEAAVAGAVLPRPT